MSDDDEEEERRRRNAESQPSETPGLLAQGLRALGNWLAACWRRIAG